MPWVIAAGCQWMVGMAFIAAQAAACLPFANSLTRSLWHSAHASGVGIPARSTSAAEVCCVPWQAEHFTSLAWWREIFQSDTTPGVTEVWQSTHGSARAE